MLYGNMNLPDAEFYLPNDAKCYDPSLANTAQFSITTDITRHVIPVVWEVTGRRHQIAA
jgi:hypothetical protein